MAAKTAKPETKKESKLGLDVKKSENFSDWYSQVRCESSLLMNVLCLPT